MIGTLFDSFPGSISTNVYRGIWLIAAVFLWLIAEKKDMTEAVGNDDDLR